jgi:hypothetical protein
MTVFQKIAVPPDGPTLQTQTGGWVIRESFLEALKRLPYFELFNIRRNPHPGQIQKKELPLLGVYILGETGVADNSGPPGAHGAISFLNTCIVGFSVMIINIDEYNAERELDQAKRAIDVGLWKNGHITNLFTSWNIQEQRWEMIDNMHFEDITRTEARKRFGLVGVQNETAMAELQYNIQITYREYFAPDITDELLRFHGDAFPAQYRTDGTSNKNEVVHVEYMWTFPRP